MHAIAEQVRTAPLQTKTGSLARPVPSQGAVKLFNGHPGLKVQVLGKPLNKCTTPQKESHLFGMEQLSR
eukprot:1538611-Amphidinium_carterae.1